MKKKSLIEIDRQICLARKKEMDQQRLGESVRNGLRAPVAPAMEKPASRSARA